MTLITSAVDAPLWTDRFRLYVGARAVSLLGDAMMPVALSVGMIGAGYGATGVGYALAAWMAPVALLVLFGGVLADRFSARRMMVLADALRMVVQLVMAAAFLTGTHSLSLILLLSAISGAATALFVPGIASMVPRVATDVQRANGVLRVIEAITTLAGPALAGVLVALWGVASVMAVDALTFGISGLCLLLLRLPAPATAARPMRVWRDLAEGWAEFRSRTWLWAVIAIWIFYGLAVFGPLLPISASIIITDLGPTAYAVVGVAFGAGTILGGLAGMRLRPARPLAAGALAMLAFALCPLVLAIDLPLWTVSAGHLAGGAGFAFWGVMWSTTVQTHVPQEALNRVFAYDVAGSIIAIPVGRALAGLVAAQTGERELMAASAVIGVLACVVLLAVPAVRGLRAAA